ncbi:MAG: hypothetical protein QOF30_619 [Acidimicrobiaceae bacterium]|jgi:uncharacterized protein (DUF1697 family)|nr:hypothetical protein [Acidimicrobiaceae bacterium]
MPVYIAMLRGINVTGHNKVPMKDLRALVEALPADDVGTYVQSGNVVFESRGGDAARIAHDIEARIQAQLGLDVAVVVRTSDELDQVRSGNPFLTGGRDHARLYVTFLAALPGPDRVRAMEAVAPAAAPDECRLLGHHVYLHCPDGYGRTKLNNAFFERKLAVTATTRNWRTVTNLAEMARR